MSKRIRCTQCEAEFEYAGIAVEGKLGHTVTQYQYKKVKEGTNPDCRCCSGGIVWLPAMETISASQAEKGDEK